MLDSADEYFEMKDILVKLEERLSENKPLNSMDSCKIHDAWVAVKSMAEHLGLEE